MHYVYVGAKAGGEHLWLKLHYSSQQGGVDPALWKRKESLRHSHKSEVSMPALRCNKAAAGTGKSLMLDMLQANHQDKEAGTGHVRTGKE